MSKYVKTYEKLLNWIIENPDIKEKAKNDGILDECNEIILKEEE